MAILQKMIKVLTVIISNTGGDKMKKVSKENCGTCQIFIDESVNNRQNMLDNDICPKRDMGYCENGNN